jgi:hypothetical protein
MEFETYKSSDGLLRGCRLSDGAKTQMVHDRCRDSDECFRDRSDLDRSRCRD